MENEKLLKLSYTPSMKRGYSVFCLKGESRGRQADVKEKLISLLVDL